MSFLVTSAYLKLILFEFKLARGSFEAIYTMVGNQPVRRRTGTSVADVALAVDRACIWYWKRVLCLQRSAVTTCLLRENGVDAHMVIGTQQIPFRAHAWVEVDGRGIGHQSQGYKSYRVLDRC